MRGRKGGEVRVEGRFTTHGSLSGTFQEGDCFPGEEVFTAITCFSPFLRRKGFSTLFTGCVIPFIFSVAVFNKNKFADTVPHSGSYRGPAANSEGGRSTVSAQGKKTFTGKS